MKKQKRQKPKSAVLALMKEPMFKMRSEKKLVGKGSYDRKQKHKGMECQQKIIQAMIFCWHLAFN